MCQSFQSLERGSLPELSEACWGLLEHGKVPCEDVLNLERFPVQKLFCKFHNEIQVEGFENMLTENVAFFIVNILFASLSAVIRDVNYLFSHLWLHCWAGKSPIGHTCTSKKKKRVVFLVQLWGINRSCTTTKFILQSQHETCIAYSQQTEV